ncbi:DsrE family protein [Halorussus salilacus]|uniref:DsrE family protein n=1 Tax=Halorussus salilacus TaxID=2953750 RepID=UPI00209EF2F4|nr:DsrE family protein [Halorussus salilacus]USZ66659.1 DsrE family protein [Halorussus salilacus]
MNAVLHFSGDESQQAHAIANARNLLEDDSTAVESVVLVANGDGVALLTSDSTDPGSVESLAEAGVALRACANSLKSRDLSEADLLDGVERVPAGVGEVVKRQADGHAYVKVP